MNRCMAPVDDYVTTNIPLTKSQKVHTPKPPREQLCNRYCNRYCSNKHTHRYCSNKHTHLYGIHGEFLTQFSIQPPPLANRFVIGTAVINTHVFASSLLDNAFRFKCAAFYMGLKRKVGLVAAKTSALQINLNIQGCIIVAPPLHAPSRAPLLLPLLLSHNIPLPHVH